MDLNVSKTEKERRKITAKQSLATFKQAVYKKHCDDSPLTIELLSTGLFSFQKVDKGHVQYQLFCKCCNPWAKKYELPLHMTFSNTINARLANHFREPSGNISCLLKLRSVNPDLANKYISKWKDKTHFESTESHSNNMKNNSIEKDNSIEKNNNVFIDAFFTHANLLASFDDFPSTPGIYLIAGIIPSVPKSDYPEAYLYLYIGRSNNLKQRWLNHHRQQQLNFLKHTLNIELEIYVLCFNDLFDLKQDQLSEIESKAIYHFQPRLNNTPIPDFNHEALFE